MSQLFASGGSISPHDNHLVSNINNAEVENPALDDAGRIPM